MVRQKKFIWKAKACAESSHPQFNPSQSSLLHLLINADLLALSPRSGSFQAHITQLLYTRL